MGFRVPDLFAGYLRHNDINDYLDYLAEKYPNLVSICVEGHSYEGRPLKSIRISYSNLSSSSSTAAANSSPECSSSSLPAKKRIRSSVSKVVMAKRKDDAKKKVLETAASATKQQRPIVLLDGGIHAREWISVATALYCIYQLTERHLYNKQLLKKLDFIIVPVVNIDGYEYSHTNCRLWRKTRKPIEGCRFIGTDCNRNFDYHWSSACARASQYTFRGVQPFSEPETMALRSLMHSLTPHCKFYLSLHAHAKALLYPWGYTRDLPSNWKVLHALAKAGHHAIKTKTGSHYRCGSIAVTMRHTAAGGSPDYAFGVAKIPYAMAMELSGGGYGFDPPPEEIRGLVTESWWGIRAMCLHVADNSD